MNNSSTLPSEVTASQAGSNAQLQRTSSGSTSSDAPRAAPSADVTASLKAGDDETGFGVGFTGAAVPSAECVASALALAQRVRDLGLHLGEVVVTGVSVGLPNGESGRAVFDAGNLHALMSGENLIGDLPAAMKQAQLDRHVVQIQKGPGGARHRRPLSAVEDVIQLASRVCGFDLGTECVPRLEDMGLPRALRFLGAAR